MRLRRGPVSRFCPSGARGYFFALTKGRNSLGCLWGRVRINTKAEPLSKEAQGGLGKVRLASVHRFRSCSAEGYDSDAPFAVLGPMSASDAVDGSSTGTSVPRMWVLLMLPRFGGANHASGHDHRSRHRQVGISGGRRRRGRQTAHPPSAEASLRPGVLPEAVAMPGWHRGLCQVASLVARTKGARAYRAPDAAGLCEALRQATEE